MRLCKLVNIFVIFGVGFFGFFVCKLRFVMFHVEHSVFHCSTWNNPFPMFYVEQSFSNVLRGTFRVPLFHVEHSVFHCST